MKKLSTRDFALLAILIAILIVLGIWNIPMPGGLSITFNMIPLAIAAIFVGPVGGLIVGVAFGTISFLQCFGILGYSMQGALLLGEGVSWVWLLVQRLIPRALDGLLLGWLYRALSRRCNATAACSITGFFAAFLNTAMFMGLLYVMFRHTALLADKMAVGFFAYVFATVGVNGLVEMAVSTALTGAIGTALIRAGFSHSDGAA